MGRGETDDEGPAGGDAEAAAAAARAESGSWLGDRMAAAARRLRFERDALDEAWVQWLWFAAGIPADRVGAGAGPLAWGRRLRARLAANRRALRICVLAPEHRGLPFGPLTAWSINRNSRLCSATLNAGLESADIVWVLVQDPITPRLKERIEVAIARRARPGVPVINRPGAINAFHEPGAFARLHAAGVNVPRFRFHRGERGSTLVVYKTDGVQGGPKVRTLYDGPRPGMSAFAFVPSSDPDGGHSRYRAHYLAGMVRPAEVIVSDHWNVCLRTKRRIVYDFALTPDETDQIERIAACLDLQYFAADFIRGAGGGRSVFTDVNVYPTIRSPQAFVRARGDRGHWHTFEARRRLGIPEPSGEDVWEGFDRAMAAFAEGGRPGLPREAWPWPTPDPGVRAPQRRFTPS